MKFAIYDGRPIWYYPTRAHKMRFAGVIDGSGVRLLGSTPVVRLRGMEPNYGLWRSTPGRTTISAASLEQVEPREPED
jgi:hypothetical protein